jgi:hypothetical protein
MSPKGNAESAMLCLWHKPARAARAECGKSPAAPGFCVAILKVREYTRPNALSIRGLLMMAPPMSKFGFRIRTRHGLIVENLLIQGRDESDAERKLRQMYIHCEILDRKVHNADRRATRTNFEDIVSLVTK